MTERHLNRSLKIGLFFLSALIFTAIFAPYLAPFDPGEKDLANRLLPPSLTHLFGTNQYGQDIFSRVIYGTQVSLFIGGVVVSISLGIGMIVGIVSGYFGGITDEVLMRIVDGFLAFPSMFLALGISAFLGQGLMNLIIALVLVEWTTFARIARGSTLAIKNAGFIEMAQWLGAGKRYTLVHHLLPNILSPVVVMATLGIGNIILAAAGLSFLGLGVQPSIPEWGAMLNDGRLFLFRAPYIMIFPGLAIMIAVLTFNILGDGLRDHMDRRMKENTLKNQM